MPAVHRHVRALVAFAAGALIIAAATIYILAPATFAGAASSVSVGGPFTLTTQTGAKLSDADLKGKPFAVFFGFTHCPEVCPTTLWETSEALKLLGSQAERLKVLFISIDPDRDTPDILARYLQSFDARIVGLTGTQAEIDSVGRAYRAFWEKVPTEDGDYTMNHTASIFLMNAEGQFVGTISYGEAADVRVRKLKRLIAGDKAV